MPLLILSSTLFALLLIQAVFYILPCVGGRKNAEKKNLNTDLQPVSVIIACKNELQNLKINLQYIINQQYPEFEIVIVDDNSTDGTGEYISMMLESKYLATLRLVKSDGQGKKAAVACGIRAAAYEHLIFTDADCRPASEKWIYHMMQCLDEENPLVLGYGELTGKTFAARFSSYDAALIAMQYMGFASLGHSYMAVGRNIAYSRKLWDTIGGFASHSELASGDDDLFVREAAQHIQPTVCFLPEAKTISPAKASLAKLLRQKARQVSSSVKYSLFDKFLSGGEIVSRTLFYALIIAMLFVNWEIALGFAAVRLVVAMFSLAWFCRAAKTDFNLFMSLIFDIFAPIFYFILLVYKILNRKTEW